MSIAVTEITLAAPDIVCVYVRDGGITKGYLQTLTVADTGGYDTWLSRTNPDTGLSDYALVLGDDKKALRFQDIPEHDYLNRAAADDASSYGTIGGRSVSSVHRVSLPYASGEYRGTTSTVTTKCVSMEHRLYLKLDGNLAEGSHTISFPAGTGLGSSAFVYDDQVTRTPTIKATLLGHRAGDTGKYAYMALWVPGHSPEYIDFSGYSLGDGTTFHVIDYLTKAIQFTGTIALRTAPGDNDVGAHSNGTRRVVRTDLSPLTMTGMTNANPCVVSYAAGGTWAPVDGDRIYLTNSGIAELASGQYTVASADAGARTFALSGQNTSAMSAYTSGTFRQIRAMRLTNLSGTYVYGMDYGAWTSGVNEREYQIWIPGLGVSDPFRISATIWHEAAANAAKGEYHLRSGCALDGRFGYERPVTQKSGVTKTIYKSYLPFAYTSYAGTTGGASITAGSTAPWATVDEHADFYGGHHDAGDWDVHLLSNLEAYYDLIDAFQQLPEAARRSNFDIPKSSDILDPILYAGTDTLPDVIHQIIFSLDVYRRTQEASGAIWGGINILEDSDNPLEPSWLSRVQNSTFWPDHHTTFVYAALASKLARLLSNEGFSALAAVWQTSAELAWDWALLIRTDQTEREAHYAVLIAALGGVATFDALTVLNRTNYYWMAAACLLTLTGDAAYQTVVDDAYANRSNGSALTTKVMWEYWQYSGISAGRKSTIESDIITFVDNSLLSAQTADCSYKTLHFKDNQANWGDIGTTLDTYMYMYVPAHKISGDDKYLKALQNGFCWMYGANQLGKSLTTGIGSRQRLGLLHRDSMSGNTPSRDTTEMVAGITAYAFGSMPPQVVALNFSNLDYHYMTSTPQSASAGAANYPLERSMWPGQECFPNYEASFEQPLVIIFSEFTGEQNVFPHQALTMYLHSVGDTPKASIRGKRKIRVRWGS